MVYIGVQGSIVHAVSKSKELPVPFTYDLNNFGKTDSARRGQYVGILNSRILHTEE